MTTTKTTTQIQTHLEKHQLRECKQWAMQLVDISIFMHWMLCFVAVTFIMNLKRKCFGFTITMSHNKSNSSRNTRKSTFCGSRIIYRLVSCFDFRFMEINVANRFFESKISPRNCFVVQKLLLFPENNLIEWIKKLQLRVHCDYYYYYLLLHLIRFVPKGYDVFHKQKHSSKPHQDQRNRKQNLIEKWIIG